MDLNAAMERLIRIGPTEAMREDEAAAGNALIQPGAVDWLPSIDWHDDVVVSTRGDLVRIIAIRARRLGTGAFSRMITGISKAGRIPVIVEPMFDMPAILERWGWSKQIVGHGFQREEQWRPTKAWLKARAALTSTDREGV